jgi:hypothetical protein
MSSVYRVMEKRYFQRYFLRPAYMDAKGVHVKHSSYAGTRRQPGGAARRIAMRDMMQDVKNPVPS